MLRIPGIAKDIRFNYAYRRDLTSVWMASNRVGGTDRKTLLSAPLMTTDINGNVAVVSFETRSKATKFARGFHLFEVDKDDAVLVSSMCCPVIVVLDTPGDGSDVELVHYIPKIKYRSVL